MTGESGLKSLLKTLSPNLLEGEYVFCTVKNSQYGDYAQAKPFASVSEAEGLTLILLKDTAEKSGLPYQGLFRAITLGVHSDLLAVGLTAAVSGALSGHGISANMIAGYFHDHVFVQSESASKALGILLELGE